MVEILLVIALIGLFSTLFIVNLDSLMRVSEGEAVESSFWEAAREARTRALVERDRRLLGQNPEAPSLQTRRAGANGQGDGCHGASRGLWR